MSTTYVIHKDGETREFEDEQQFEDTVDLLADNDVDFETEVAEDGMSVADGGDAIQTVDAEVVDHSENGAEDTEDALDASEASDAQTAMDVATQSLSDPLDTLPEWMKTEVSYNDRGDSSTTINKRGCEVIANFLNLEPDFEVLTSAEETDFEYAYHSCTVTTDDGKTFTGYGTARADGSDQGENEGWKVEMMAQTRAYKRAVKFATGDGIEAFVEAQR